jgi:hypothetical protein
VAGNVVTYGSNEMYDDLITTAIANPTATTVYSWSPTTDALTNVISASATTYTNNWFTTMNLDQEYPLAAGVTYTSNANSQLDKFFYPLKTYAYRDKVHDANNTANKIYKGGLVESSFKFFNWTAASNPTEWYSDGTITKYSPYGYPVEEQDVLGIKSSAKFGYNNTLPVAVVQNAGYNETKFIDFEYGFVSSPTGSVTTQFAHTGRASFDLSLNPNYNFVTNYPISTEILGGKGLGIKLWLRNSLSEIVTSPNYRLKNPNLQLKAIIGSQPFDMKLIAQTGEWSLYSVDIKNFNTITSAGNYNIKFSYNHSALGSEKVLIDDFRIQPLDASMNCSVYLADNKVAAQFDDQHFGVFYEYNNKGQLVRKSIETERGKKTLQEQQYNTPLIIKN